MKQIQLNNFLFENKTTFHNPVTALNNTQDIHK